METQLLWVLASNAKNKKHKKMLLFTHNQKIKKMNRMHNHKSASIIQSRRKIKLILN